MLDSIGKNIEDAINQQATKVSTLYLTDESNSDGSSVQHSHVSGRDSSGKTAKTAKKEQKQPKMAKLKSVKEQETVAVDTTVYAPKYLAGFPDTTGNSINIQRIDQKTVMTEPTHSHEVNVRYQSPLHDNGTMLLVFAVIAFMLVSYSKGKKYVSDLFYKMFSIKKRENLFEDHTVKETQILFSLIANTCLFGAIIMFEGLVYYRPELYVPDLPIYCYVLMFGIFLGVFFLVQVGVYNMLGFVFSEKVETKLWIDGFKASHAILGIILAPITFVMLIYPEITETMLVVAVILYFSARFVFICKGFRIFFNNLSSLIYFILYLCSVEIVPVILSLAGAIKLCIILQQAVLK